jgi:hypothetical protein
MFWVLSNKEKRKERGKKKRPTKRKKNDHNFFSILQKCPYKFEKKNYKIFF